MSDLLEESVVVSLCQIQIVDFETVHTSIKPYTVYIILSRQERGIADEYIYSLNCMSFLYLLSDGKTSTVKVRRYMCISFIKSR